MNIKKLLVLLLVLTLVIPVNAFASTNNTSNFVSADQPVNTNISSDSQEVTEVAPNDYDVAGSDDGDNQESINLNDNDTGNGQGNIIIKNKEKNPKHEMKDIRETSIQYQIKKVVSQAEKQNLLIGKDQNSIKLIIQTNGTNITSKLQKAGAQVVNRINNSIYAVTIPKNKVENIAAIAEIKKVSLEKIYKLDPKEKLELDSEAKANVIKPNIGTTLDDTKVTVFSSVYGTDGNGITIAVIDTGVEPNHEFLRNTTAGNIKIIDWQDFTHEGDVAATKQATVPEAVYEDVYSTVKFNISGLHIKTDSFIVSNSLSGDTVYLGEFQESDKIDEEGHPKDFNFDGDADDYFPVLVFGNPDGSDCDSIIVDTNLNGNFTDDDMVKVYNENVKANEPYDQQEGIIGRFPENKAIDARQNQRFNFVLTKVEPIADGMLINIGFDGGSHGTHVSGIAAGYNPDATDLNVARGVAPGANIMALKVLGTSGSGGTEGILEAMQYAAEHGADIVNMSLGSFSDINDGSNDEAELADYLSDHYGVTFAISAGNNGSGINTIGSPGDSVRAVSSGAYIETDTWAEYEADNPDTYGLWYFSSTGPKEDGSIKPTIISPGSAISSVPSWEADHDFANSSGAYDLYQGTSMASPHTAGIIALLTQKARDNKLIAENGKLNPVLVGKALRYTGDKENLSNYQFAEIGGGLADVVAAYQYIENNIDKDFDKSIDVRVDYGEKLTDMKGIFVRNGDIPDEIEVMLTNNDSSSVTLNLSKYNNGNWFSFSPSNITIPAHGNGYINVVVNDELEAGLYSDCIMGDDGDGVIDVEIPVTIVKGMTINSAGNYSTSVEGAVESSKYERQFVYVPNGTASLKVTLNVETNGSGTALGRMRILGFNPDGMENPNFNKLVSGYAGLGSSTNTITYIVDNPKSGMWELDVYSTYTQANLQKSKGLDVEAAPYTLDISLGGIIVNPDKWKLTAPAASSHNNTFEFKNLMGESIQAKVDGSPLFDRAMLHPVDENIDFTSDDVYYFDFVDIDKDAANMIFNLGIESLTSDKDDFDLYLYAYDAEEDEVGNLIAACADGDANESISMNGLASGSYLVVIENFGATDTTIRYSKEILNTNSEFETSGTINTDTTALNVSDGAIWSRTANINIPSTINHTYIGLLMVRDASDNSVITSIPVTVKTTPASSTINPTTATFDKYVPANIAVTMTPNGNTLSAIKNGTSTLVTPTDYTVSGNVVTLKSSYLSTLSTGAYTIIFDFNYGVDPTLTLSVINTKPSSDHESGGNSGGSGSGGGGGGSSSSSTTPTTPTPQVNGDKIAVPTPTLNTTTKEATAKVSESTLASALANATANSNGVKIVTVTVPKVAGANSYAVELPTSAFSGATGAATQIINIQTELGNLSIPNNMVSQELAAQGKPIAVSIGKADISKLPQDIQAQIGNRPVIELSLEVGGVVTAWSNPNAPITVSVSYTPTAEELKNPDNIVVWYIDGAGNAIAVPNCKYDPATGMVTFQTTHFSKYAVVYAKNTFSDVTSYEKEITAMVSRDILKPVSKTTFNPNTSITRADFIYGLVRALGLTAKADSNFTDVKASAYYYNEVAIAKKLGITNGSGNNMFKPETTITRQDMMTLIYRAMTVAKKLNTSADISELSKFADNAKIASYAKASVASVVKEGIIKGDGTNINPQSNTSRAEAALILYRIFNK